MKICIKTHDRKGGPDGFWSGALRPKVDPKRTFQDGERNGAAEERKQHEATTSLVAAVVSSPLFSGSANVKMGSRCVRAARP